MIGRLLEENVFCAASCPRFNQASNQNIPIRQFSWIFSNEQNGMGGEIFTIVSKALELYYPLCSVFASLKCYGLSFQYVACI